MAGIRVTLAKGTGFSDEEWTAADKEVLILNTRRRATADLSTGTVTATGDAEAAGITPYRKGGDFRAVLAPQEVAAGTQLLSVTVDGASYKFSRSEATVFHPSRQHNFTITVNKKGMGDFEFTVSGESVTAWENDTVSHDATIKEYVVIDVETPGTLDECVKAAGKDLAKIKNLKLTGKINSRDFAVMKYLMSNLKALNLKEARIVKGESGVLEDFEYGVNGGLYDREAGEYLANEDGEIPWTAFRDKKSLSTLSLPEGITKISQEAFSGCESLTGSLIIPEGVTSIETCAFAECKSLSGQLYLPTTLKRIGVSAFLYCDFCCELNLPAALESIGGGAFGDCTGFYGELHLPEALTVIEYWSFKGTNFSGSLRIPNGVTIIEGEAFRDCKNLDGTLILNDNITSIEQNAFRGCRFHGGLRLPKSLEYLYPGAFWGCDFSGEIIIPEGLSYIAENAFNENRHLSGILEIPNNVNRIRDDAFADCNMIEGLVFPKDLESIRSGAFSNCFGIKSIVCKGDIPPAVMSGAFAGVPKDNFTVEVPESAVAQYRTANGWKDFKRIAAYRNFVVRPSKASALNSRTSRDIILDADDEWTVESMPGWVRLSQNEGKGKTKLRLDFLRMPSGTSREGDIVFKLKDKDYRTTCHVSQHDYSRAEDEVLTLQEASKGAGVNIVFLGDGYDAKDIRDGLLLNDIDKAVGHFFDIEPYRTYRDYFNVYTAISLSPESGIGGVNTIINNRFNTTFLSGADIGGRYGKSDYNEIFEYACKAPTVDEGNLNRTLIVIIPNTAIYSGTTYMYSGGEAISYCPKSESGYPYDFRGVIQHEAGGHGFAKLGDECVYFNAFPDGSIIQQINAAQKSGWYENLSTTGKMNEVPWSHLIFDKRYSAVVDIFEGGFTVSRGIFRSEANSCMNNSVPYYNAISREAIVKRIMEYAGQEYSFEDFVANDKTDGDESESGTAVTRSGRPGFQPVISRRQNAPVFMGSRKRTVKK